MHPRIHAPTGACSLSSPQVLLPVLQPLLQRLHLLCGCGLRVDYNQSVSSTSWKKDRFLSAYVERSEVKGSERKPADRDKGTIVQLKYEECSKQ